MFDSFVTLDNEIIRILIQNTIDCELELLFVTFTMPDLKLLKNYKFINKNKYFKFLFWKIG